VHDGYRDGALPRRVLPDPCCLLRFRAGSASTWQLSGPAQASHALRPAGLLARHLWTLSRGSDQPGYPDSPLARCRSQTSIIRVGPSPTGNQPLWGTRESAQCHLLWIAATILHKLWGGPPGPRGSPWTRFSPTKSASSTLRRADGGVGCGPGGPPHNQCRLRGIGKVSGIARKRLPHKSESPCAPGWDRRFRLSSAESQRFFHSF